MALTPLAASRFDGSALIRNEPVQARSTARLAALLDAAAQVIDEIGYERLTTAMVADRAGASIGTVYRYFPDRIAVLQSLSMRNAERIIDRVLDAIRDSRHTDWRSATNGALDALIEAFRSEPGFASLRLGDVIDLRPASGTPANSVLAERMHDAVILRFGLVASDEVRRAFEAAVEVADALIARAFARDSNGDEIFITHARAAVDSILTPRLG